MIQNLNENYDFSLKLSSFNIEILFKSKKGNYIINKNRPFDPLLNLSKDIEEIKNNLKSNRQDVLNFLYFNMENIEKVLYNIDEIIYFDFDDKNNKYFLIINNEKIEIEQKNEMAFLFYISLLINYNKNIVNFSFSIHLINKIISLNNIDENNLYKNILISKIILELINFYKSNQIFEEKNNKDEKENLNNLDNYNYIIENFINEFKKLGLEINQKDLKLKNIDLIYAEIINTFLQFKHFNLISNIIDQLDLENINITKAMFNEISKTLSSNESYINEYRLNSFDDLFVSQKVDFYFILFKCILKNPIFIYDIEFLNEARKIIIKRINSNQNQSISLSNNIKKIIDSNFKDKVIYIIQFFTNSEYEVKYINLNDNNILNSKLSSDSNTKNSSLNPFDLSSFKEQQERSRRYFSMYDQNIGISEILEERNEENQINIQNYISHEEIRNNISPLDSKSFAQRNQENENINLTINQKFNLSHNEIEIFKNILDDIQKILKKSSITLSINNKNENTIEYSEMVYDKGVGITYKKFKNYFSEEQDQKWVMDYFDNIFNNYKKLIDFFEKIKEIAKNIFLFENKFSIKINLKEVGPKNNNEIKNIISEYKLDNVVSLNDKYKDENILNKDNYEGFISFSKQIINIPFQISSISSIKKKTNTNSLSTIWAIIDKTERYQFISFKKLIGKHQKVAEKIMEKNKTSFLSAGYNELFEYNMDSGKIGVHDIENFYSFFINKNQVIISQKKKINFLNNPNLNIETEYSCRNILSLKDNNYLLCNENGVFYASDLNNNFQYQKRNIVNEKVYRGGIKLNGDKDCIVAITSNSVLPKGENKIIFFNSNSKRFMNELEVKDYSKNYSFNLSENNCALMKIPKHGNSKLLLCACKKYIKDDKNGILLLILKFDKNDKETIPVFYDTKNFEVYCFCPILEIVENKNFFGKNNDKVQINDTEYFFVGGFDLNKREGLIKLYKVIYNDEIKKIKIEYIQDIIVGRKISNDDTESFKRFKGTISCMIQSSRGGIFITCYDGSVYLFSKPDIDSLLKENYNILK